ncbi:ATP-binding protein [Streptomyces sp. NPDC059371]|uniref:ATP-binding protein n=1 Tax=Streptomyces sp. NPDC059371 TaxID=3346812 RepID=UPI0036B8F411
MDRSPENISCEQPGVPALAEVSLALDSDGTRIAHARDLAAAFLDRVRHAHGIPVVTATVEIVQLIVSELVTNARRYAPGPALLHLRIVGTTLQVGLWDSSPVLPVPKSPDPKRIGQHGLEIVAALAQSLTVEATPVGKRVTAHVALYPAGTASTR